MKALTLLALLALCPGCASFRAVGPPPLQEGLEDLEATTAAARAVSLKAPADEAAAKSYADVAMALSQLRCEAYFRSLSAQDATVKFAQGAANATGGLASAIMGLAGVAGGPVGGFGAGMSFVNALFARRAEAYLPGPDLIALATLARRAQLCVQRVIQVDNPPKSYADAERAVADFDHLCSFSGLRALATQAVDAAEVAPVPVPNESTWVPEGPQGPSPRAASPKWPLPSAIMEIRRAK